MNLDIKWFLLPFCCQNWGCQLLRNKYFPLCAGLGSITLLVLLVGVWAYYWDLWSTPAPIWFEEFGSVVIFAMCGLSLAGLITGVSHLFKRVFKPIIILGTLLSGLTTILSARIVYIHLFEGFYR